MNPIEPKVPTKPKAKEISKADEQWEKELYKFLGAEVTVDYEVLATTDRGTVPTPSALPARKELRSVSGTLRAFQRHSVMTIVDTPKESVFIRYPLEIKRARKAR